MTEIERRISNSFIKLLDKEPIDQVTVTEICRVAGVSKRSFYNYFCDKYDVIIKIQAIPELGEEDVDLSLNTLENYFRKRYKWLLEHRNTVRNISFYLGQNSSIIAFMDSVTELLWKVIGRYHPEVERTPDLVYAVNCFVYGFLVSTINIVLNDPEYCEEFFLREHFLEGFIPPIISQYLHY